MIEKKRKYVLFLGISLGMTIIFWTVALLTRGKSIAYYFSSDSCDTYMDYFHMLSNIDGLDPYYQNANYPALPFVIWRVLYRMIPWNQSNSDGFFLRTNMYAELGFILLMLLCIIIIWEMLQYYLRSDSKDIQFVFPFSILFSGAMLFTIERGNIILLSFLFSLLFIALYDSDKKEYRYVAYICLALSAAIKIYPAVLGVLVLNKKRYKECLVLIFLGIVFFVLPFFAFGGMDSFLTMLKGIMLSSSENLSIGFGYNFSFSNFVRIIAAICGKYIEKLPTWLTIIVPTILCLGTYIANTAIWKKVYALVMFIVWIPSFSYTYTLLFFVLPLILFLKDEKELLDPFYAISFALILAPWCLPKVPKVNFINGAEFKFYLTGGMLIVNIVLLCMLLILLVSGIIKHIERKDKPYENS